MAGFGGFLGGLGTAIGGGINTYSALQQQQMRAAQLAQQRLKMQQAQQAQQNLMLLGNYALEQQQQQPGAPALYQPPGPNYLSAPPPPSAPPPAGSAAPGGSFMPVNPGAPPMGPGGRPVMPGAPSMTPAAAMAAPGAAATRATASAGASFDLAADPMTYFRRIAQGIKKANPSATPAQVYSATMQHISTLQPLALTQYRDQALAFRAEYEANNIANRIRDLDIRQQAGADKRDMQSQLLAVRRDIADARERGLDQRQQNSLTVAVMMLAAKAGIDPSTLGLSLGGGAGSGGAGASRGGAGQGSSGAMGALGQVASAVKGQKNAKVRSADDGYRLAAKTRSEANKEINTIIGRHGGQLPQPVDLDYPAFQAARNRRDAAARGMVKARALDPKLPAWDDKANGLSSPAAAAGAPGATQDNPAKPQTQSDFSALPSGAFYIDPDDGKLYQK